MIDYAQSAVAVALHSESPALHQCAALVEGYIRAARVRATHGGVAH